MCLLASLKGKVMANCANELPELGDIARVESPVTYQNIEDAYDQMMFIKVVSLLLARQDQNVARHLDGKTLRREIYVPGRIVNFVVG